MSQDPRSVANPFGGGILVGPMTHAFSTRDEEHPDGRYPSHEQRIMIRPADHGLMRAALYRTRLHESVNNERRRSEEHTSELQSRQYLVCRLLLEKKKQQ